MEDCVVITVTVVVTVILLMFCLLEIVLISKSVRMLKYLGSLVDSISNNLASAEANINAIYNLLVSCYEDAT